MPPESITFAARLEAGFGTGVFCAALFLFEPCHPERSRGVSWLSAGVMTSRCYKWICERGGVSARKACMFQKCFPCGHLPKKSGNRTAIVADCLPRHVSAVF